MSDYQRGHKRGRHVGQQAERLAVLQYVRKMADVLARNRTASSAANELGTAGVAALLHVARDIESGNHRVHL
jgi:hypothetical protein